jgi:Domain of unknown function (DUF4136)
MRRIIFVPGLITMIMIFSTSMEARKIKVDVQFEKQTDFSKFRTYSWMEHQPVARPMLALQVGGATDYELRALGLKKVDADPDVLFTFSGGINTSIGVAANDPTYATNGGVPPLDSSVWSGGARSFTHASAVYVQKGTLVIEMVDARSKKVLWRGTATGNLDTRPSKSLEGIDKAVERLFREFPAEQILSSRN